MIMFLYLVALSLVHNCHLLRKILLVKYHDHDYMQIFPGILLFIE